MLKFSSYEEWITGNHDAPDPQDGIVGDYRLGAIRHIHCHSITLFQPKLLQPGRELINQSVELTISQLVIIENEGCVVWVLGCCVAKYLMDRDWWVI